MAKSFYSIIIDLQGDKETKGGLEDIGKAAGLTGAALTAFSAAAAKTAASYETSLAAVQTIADESTGSLAEYDAAVTDLSNRMGGALSINQAAAASYDVLSSGYKDQADVLYILEQGQKTATGGFAELADITDATTTILNSYGDQLGDNLSVQEKVAKINDQMIQTQNLGKIVAGQYAAKIGSVASTAAVAGVGFEELNAAIATSTSNGVSAGSTFAGTNQILSQLSKPTKEAQEAAAALGIEFNAAALKSKGLSGVLSDVIGAGGASTETMFKLFGSVEAVKVAMTLVKNEGAQFENAIAGMGDSVGASDAAFNIMSDTVEFKATAALNKLNNTMVRLGQGALLAIEPIIDLISFLAGKFNELPVPLQQAIGLLTLATGVVLTAGGAILILSTSLGAIAGAWATATTAAAAFQLALSGMTLASVGAGLASVGAAALVAAPYLLAVAAAIAAVAAAAEYMKNIEIEKEANRYLGALSATEDLASKAQIMANKIFESGQALPDSEFDAFIQVLKDADDGTGTLSGQITALTNVQNRAKNGTLEMSDAQIEAQKSSESRGKQEELTQEQIEAAAAAEAEAHKALKERVAADQTILDSDLREKMARIDLESTSEESALREKLALQEEALSATQANQQQLIDSELTTEGERAQIQAQLTQKITELAQEQHNVQTRLAEMTKDKVMAQLSTQEARANLMFDNQELSAGQYYAFLNELLESEKALRLGVLQEQLSNAEEGSLEQAKALSEIAQLDLEIANQIKSNSEAVKQAKVDSINEVLELSVNASQTEIAQQELLYKQGVISELEYLQFVKDSTKQQTEAKISAIDQELALTQQGSRQYKELINERAMLEAQLGKDLIANQEQITAARLSSIKQLSEASLADLELRAMTTKELYDQGTLSEQEYIAFVKASIQEQSAIKIAAINEELALGVSSQAKATELEQKRAQLEIKMRQDVRAEEVKLFDLSLANIKALAETQKSEIETQMGFVKAQSSMLDNQDSLGSGLSSILGNISSQLKEDNLTLENRAKLEGISEEVLTRVKQLGISINSDLTKEQQIAQAIAQIEVFKLGLKQKQLEVQRQLIQQEAQVQALELQSNITTAQAEINNGGLSNDEATKLQQEISLNQQKLELLKAQTQAKLEANAINSELVGLEQQVAGVTASQSAVLPTEATPSEGNSEVVAKASETAQSTAETASSTQSIPDINTDVKSTLSSVDILGTSSSGIESALSAFDAAVSGNFGQVVSSLQGIQSNTQMISGQLQGIQSQLGSLPSAIASMMPRPAPIYTPASR